MLDLKKGGASALTATITPADATDKAISWTTSDPKVVTVDASGQVTATGGGKAQITVTTHDGNFSAHCDVTVTVPAKGVSLNKSSLLLIKGASEKLQPVFLPADATDQAVTWTSSNPAVATVDETGKVTAVSTGGSATVTVTTNDGGFTASCEVSTAIPVTGIKLDKTSLTINQGDTAALTAIISPTDATDKTVIWSSSNTSVLTISSSGVITAKKYGTATITAKTQDGGFTATCQVTVVAAVQVKIISSEGARRGGSFSSNGSGKIEVYSTYWDDDPQYYKTVVDLTFAKPMTYTATKDKYSYFDNTAPAETLIKFVNSKTETGFGASASLALLDIDNNKQIAYQGHGEPWFDQIPDHGMRLYYSGQATHFQFVLKAELFATEAHDDEAFLSWDKIIFCGILLTDIQVIS